MVCNKCNDIFMLFNDTNLAGMFCHVAYMPIMCMYRVMLLVWPLDRIDTDIIKAIHILYVLWLM